MRRRSNRSVVLVSLSIVGISLAAWLSPRHVASQPSGVRLAIVNVPEDVLGPLLPDFEKQAGFRAVIVYTG